MRATALRVLIGLFVALLLHPAAGLAAPQACTPDNVHTLTGAWARIADETGGASDYGLTRAELAGILKRMDGYAALFDKALLPLRGYTGHWHKLISAVPFVEHGPVAQDISGVVDSLSCKAGKLVPISDAGNPRIEVNSLWTSLGKASFEIDGKQAYLLGFPLGALRGYPLIEPPYESDFGGDVHRLTWTVLVTASGRLPFHYVTRREYLTFARSAIAAAKVKDAAMWRTSLKVRPAAEQAAEKQHELEKIDREPNVNRREHQRARYLSEYRTDEQKRDEAVRKSGENHDAQLARIAAIEAFYTPAQLDEPAIVNRPDPSEIDARWAFSTDLKTDRNHVCTSACGHGQQLVVIDDRYVDRKVSRAAPQVFEVDFTWLAGVKEGYRNPVAEKLRDDFFARFDFDALAAMLPASGGVGKPGPALAGLSSGGPTPPTFAPRPPRPAPRPEAAGAVAATQAAPAAPAPPTTYTGLPPVDAPDTIDTYNGVVAEGDRLFATGDYFEAVRIYERASRVAYRGKLAVDKAALDARLAKARVARDKNKK